MTIPLDNLYDYIFSLTGHNNKNLIMYRFDPHGSKNLENLIIHNKVEEINISIEPLNKKVISFHYKLLFCYDQEPLNFDLYEGEQSQDSRKKLFNKDGVSHFHNKIGQKLLKQENIAGHPSVPPSIYDKKLLLHSEKNSKDLKKYEQNGFLGIYYWSHAFIALDWYRFAKHDKSLAFIKKLNFKKDFNVYARAWTGSREYRLKFLELLNKRSIDKKSTIFFNSHDHDNNNYSEYKFENDQWQINIRNIDNLIFYSNEDISSSVSATYDTQDYETSAIDVVLETVFDKNKIQLTEKILRPIACGKPFILVSEKESLAYLKSYGFKTFGNIIDENYDLISDPTERLYAIVNTMEKISNLPEREKSKLFLKMHEIAEENKKWFFSEDFFNLINNELTKNIKNGLSILDNTDYQTAKHLRLMYRSYRLYKKFFDIPSRKKADTFISEHFATLKLSKKNIGKY